MLQTHYFLVTFLCPTNNTLLYGFDVYDDHPQGKGYR